MITTDITPRGTRRIILAVIGLCASLLSAPLTAGALPAFSSLYQVSREGFGIGEAQFTLSKEADNRYVYESHTYPTGIAAWFFKDTVEERSKWTQQAHGIVPLEYLYERSGGKKERHAQLSFDWEQGTVENHVEGQPWQMDIPIGTLDKLVVTLAMMLDLKAQEKDLEYTIADGGKLKHYRFKIVGEERISSRAGEFDTVKLERVREDTKRSTYLWCAPALHYLPVRIEQHEDDGTVYSSLLKEVSEGLRKSTQ